MRPAARPSLALCINTRNRPDGLARLLESVAPQAAAQPGCRIIVVNDGSHDARYAEVLRRHGAMVDYHPLSPRVGIPAARNIAASHAEADFLVFIDDDCVAPPFWLDWLMALIETEPELDVIAGVTRPLLPETPGFFARVQQAFGLYPNPEKRLGGLRFVTANLAIRRSLFTALGGFRSYPGGPASGSDTDLSDRVCWTACARRLDPHWYVFHDVGEAVPACMARYWRYGYADMWLGRFARPAGEGAPAGPAASSRIGDMRRLLKANRNRARSVFPTGAQQLRAALLASLIQLAYLEGRRAGARARPPAPSAKTAC